MKKFDGLFDTWYKKISNKTTKKCQLRDNTVLFLGMILNLWSRIMNTKSLYTQKWKLKKVRIFEDSALKKKKKADQVDNEFKIGLSYDNQS